MMRMKFDPDDLAESLGYSSIQDYQDWFGLEPDGIVGPITSAHMTQPRCGVPDVMAAGISQIPRSCMDHVEVFYSFNGMRATAEDIRQAWSMAVAEWNQACGINLVFVKSLSESRIHATAGPLQGSTLAWSYLPQGNCSDRMEQKYNTSLSGRDYLAKVILHEVGHAIGLEHSRNQLSIMYPSIQSLPFSSYPNPEDIQQVVDRYGPPADKPPQPPAELQVFIDGVKYVPAG